MLDADERAILFLCCENHLVLCEVCGRERPMQTLRRRSSDPDRWLCPKCRHDVSGKVLEHTRACRYFSQRTSLGSVVLQDPPSRSQRVG